MKKVIVFIVALATALSNIKAQTFNAVQFSANTDYISTNYNPSFGTSQDFSIEFRIKTSSWTGDPALLSDKDWASGFNQGFNIALASNGTGIDVNVGDGSNRADLESGTINDGNWHHVLVTFDRDADLSLYIDGVLEETDDMSSVGNVNSTFNVALGQDGTTTYGRAATCELADIRVWNKILALAEADQYKCDYVDNTHPSYADLIHEWRMDEGTGTTAADNIGTFDGTLQGGTSWTTGNMLTIGCSQATELQAAGHALDFDGVNDKVIIPSSPSLRFTDAFTVEAWVNPRSFSQWESFLSHAQDNLGDESGYGWDFINGQLRFRIAQVGMPQDQWNSDPGFPISLNEWTHVAATYENDTLKVYKNGILEGSRYKPGGVDYTFLPNDFRIGAFHDDNEDFYFDGQVDEVRLWSQARTETQLRNMMCRKLTGSESSLAAYYRFDELAIPVLPDASSNGHNGLLNQMDASTDWVKSGAALGDTSVYTYTNNWLGNSVSMPSNANGNLSASNITNNPAAVHLYRVDEVPTESAGLNGLSTNDVFFGAFIVSDSSYTFDLGLDYSNQPDAVANEANLYLGFRNNQSVQPWVNYNASLQIANDLITKTSLTTRGEYMLTGLTAFVCDTPLSFSTSNATFNAINLSVVASPSGLVNIEYGVQGFVLGSGTSIVNQNATNPITVDGLQGNTAYDFYVQDTCAGFGTSAWLGPISATTLLDVSNIGSGKAVNIAENGWIDCSNGKASAISLGLPTSEITVEAWVKPSSYTKWHSFVSFIQDNGSFERGWSLETRDANKMGFALKSVNQSSLTYLETNNAWQEDTWYHIAGVYTGDTLKVYVNGELEATSTAQSGAIDYADSWLSIGSYKDDNEDVRVDAAIDEVRIWDFAKTTTEIRTDMCQKLTGAEAGLVSYYNLNEGVGTTIADLAGSNNGTFTGSLDASAWINSGAAIGDTSTYVHATDYTGTTLALSSTNRGNAEVNTITGSAKGIHVYRVDNVSNSTTGIFDVQDQNTYYGVFVAQNPNGNAAAYNLDYYYTNYPNAVANEASLNLYGRRSGEILTWTGSGASVDASNDVVTLTGATVRREYLLADFIANPCNSSSNLSANNLTIDGAYLVWTAGDGVSQTIEYGVAGFSLGNGTQIPNATSPYTLGGLGALTSYDFYVQDDCGANGTSTWVGPFTFSTLDPCPAPTSFTLSAVTDSSATFDITTNGQFDDWILLWGPSGGNPNFYIQTQTSGIPATLLGLQPETTYDVYLQADCDSLSSGLLGPITISTDTADPCPSPTSFTFNNITESSATIDIAASGTSNNWIVVWGPEGGNVNLFNRDTLSGNPLLLNGLQAETSYDVYIQAACDSLAIGPNVFTTLSDSTPNSILSFGNKNLISIYPNPSSGLIHLEQVQITDIVNVVVYELSGKQIVKLNNVFASSRKAVIDLNGNEGVFVLELTTNDNIQTHRLIIIK